jgi:hypothetical protein
MFRSSAHRLRAWLEGAGDLLADDGEAESTIHEAHLSHPHRRPLRLERDRRPGSVPPRWAHCVSPVRPSSGSREPAPR